MWYLCLFFAAAMSNQPTELTDQNKTESSDKRKRQLETTYHCTHLLSVLIERPELWPTSEFKRIRECIFTMRANPQTYGPVVGGAQPDGLINQESNQPTQKLPALTTNYILDIAKHKDGFCKHGIWTHFAKKQIQCHAHHAFETLWR